MSVAVTFEYEQEICCSGTTQQIKQTDGREHLTERGVSKDNKELCTLSINYTLNQNMQEFWIAWIKRS
jgi:hypothetical protein